MAKISTLKDVQAFVSALGCGQETHGPNVFRVTTHDPEVAVKVVKALKGAGIFVWEPREDPLDQQGNPDLALPREKGKLIKDAVKDCKEVGRKSSGADLVTQEPIWLYFVDVGWKYEKVPGAEQEVVQIAHSRPTVMAVEVTK